MGNSSKGKSTKKIRKAQMKECEKCKKNVALTDLNVPNGSQHSSFQIHELEKGGSRQFEGFQLHFHANMMSQMQPCKTMKNESAISQESFVDLLKILQAVRTWQRNFAGFQV